MFTTAVILWCLSPLYDFLIVTLQTLLLEIMTFLAMSFPCMILLVDKYIIPRATCWEKLRSNLGVILKLKELETVSVPQQLVYNHK